MNRFEWLGGVAQVGLICVLCAAFGYALYLIVVLV